MRRPPATAACPPGASTSRRQHLQQLGSLGLLATGSLSSLHALTAQAQDRQLPLHVLLIGNANYQRNAVLRNPARDVQLLAQAFGARGAKVQTLLDQSAQQMDTAIAAFLRQLQRTPAAVWIGYSGHAVQMDGRNFLQGIDSDFSTAQRVRAHGLDLEKVVRLVERTQPQAAVVAVDACRNNPFEPERTRGVALGLAPLEPKGICVSFSTAPYTKALDGDEGNYSPYAQALAQALSGTQNKSLDHVLRATANSVFARTAKRQIPEYRSSLRAEWWFTPKTVALRPLPSQGAGGAVTGSSTREVAYRPDEPRPTADFSRTSARQWTQLNQQLQIQQQRTSAAQARQLMLAAAGRNFSDFDRLLLSCLLQDGHPGLQRAPERARQLLQPLAEQGHAVAQNLLGESWFLEQTYDQAYKWISLAARSGYGRARTNLGQLHTMGLSDTDPTTGAFELLEGMLQQTQEQLAPLMQQPEITPQAQQIIDRFQHMLRPGGQ